MGKKMQGSNSTGQTKAGKKSGSYIAPPAPNADKRDGRLVGEKQFVRDSNARLDKVQEVGSPFAGLAAAFGVRSKPGPSWDTGLRFDSARGRVIVPHGQLTNGY